MRAGPVTEHHTNEIIRACRSGLAPERLNRLESQHAADNQVPAPGQVFDLVLVIAPGSSQRDANVIALQMYRVSFGGGLDFGLGSALGVLLFLLVLPAMLFNIRRMRREQR